MSSGNNSTSRIRMHIRLRLGDVHHRSVLVWAHSNFDKCYGIGGGAQPIPTGYQMQCDPSTRNGIEQKKQQQKRKNLCLSRSAWLYMTKFCIFFFVAIQHLDGCARVVDVFFVFFLLRLHCWPRISTRMVRSDRHAHDNTHHIQRYTVNVRWVLALHKIWEGIFILTLWKNLSFWYFRRTVFCFSRNTQRQYGMGWTKKRCVCTVYCSVQQ